MKKVLLAVTFLAIVVTAEANSEILKCEGSLVNSRNDFEKNGARNGVKSTIDPWMTHGR